MTGWQEIDIASGELRPAKPPDGSKWDEVASGIDEAGDPKLYRWEQTGGGNVRETGGEDILVYIRIPAERGAKNCKVEFKRNWLHVWAPAMTESQVIPDDAPPKEPLLDMQLYGAVDADMCDWNIERTACEATLVLEMRKSPEYRWPTLHREHGLPSEKSRALHARELSEEARREAEKVRERMARSEGAPKPTAEYAQPAGPARPPSFGPEPMKVPPAQPMSSPAKPPAKPKQAKQPGPMRPPGSYERGRILVSEPDVAAAAPAAALPEYAPE